jgi:hypothetical protein
MAVELFRKTDTVMHLKIFVEDAELKLRYAHYIAVHNAKLVDPGEMFLDAGFDIFVPRQTGCFRGRVNKFNFGVKCSAKTLRNNGTEFYTGYYLYPRSSISKTPLRLANSVGIIEAQLPQHADHMEGQSVAAQPADAPHGGGMTAQAGAGAAMGIVDECRSVQAHPHADLVALEALTPALIYQRAIGLDRLVDGAIPVGMTLQCRLDAAAGLVIEAHWHCQWLPRMPEQGEVAADEGAAEHPIQDRI